MEGSTNWLWKALSRVGFLNIPALIMFILASGCASTPAVPSGQRVEAAFNSYIKGKPELAGASMLIHSDKHGIHTLLKADPEGPDAYHIASIGKTFTSVLIGRLVDSGKLHFDDSVAQLLEPGLLDGLFVFKDVNHQGDVTIEELLAHTSGIADYFDDPASGSARVSELIASDPDRMWTADELLAFSRDRQHAVGAPGAIFHYSDTGYIILGLVVEKLYGAAFDQVLASEILGPLGMDRTWMPWRSEPASGSTTMRKAWLGKSEVSASRSVSADWSGGGIASTEEDLLRFQKALWDGRLLSQASFTYMQSFDHEFRQGMRYGRGLMQFRFEEFMFLLASWPRMTGHIGILSTHMLYDPKEDIHVIVNFCGTAAMEDSVRLIIDVLGITLGRT